MLPTLPIPAIHSRAKAINVSLKRLARAKGISVATVYRAARGVGDCRIHTATLLTAALIEEERRLFDHLLILHGVSADRMTAIAQGAAEALAGARAA